MFIDTFHDTMAEAMLEVSRRRSEVNGNELVTRVEHSPYGGYKVRSFPADLWIDLAADGVPFASPSFPREVEMM